MKVTKLMALLLVAAMLCMSFAACSGNGGPGAASPSANGGTSAGGETIKVGILAPLTGDVAQYGIAASNAAQLYFDQLNAAGGINGKQVEYIVLDEKGQAADAITAFNNMVEQGITALVGDVTTAPTVAVADVAEELGMPMISGTATASAVTCHLKDDGTVESVRDTVFRTCFIDPFQGEKMAGFAKEVLGASTAAIIYNNATDYSKGLADAFTAKAKELGLEVVATESYADSDVDFKSQLTNIASKSPDVVFCPDYYQKIALISKQAKDTGISATLLGGDGWDGTLGAVTDASLVEGAYYCSGFSADDTSEAVQTFLTDYKAKYNQDPTMFAATTYDAAAILADALKAAEDKGLTAGTDEYKQAVAEAIKKTDRDCVTGHITFDEYNNPIKDAVIINIKDGKDTFSQKY